MPQNMLGGPDVVLSMMNRVSHRRGGRLSASIVSGVERLGRVDDYRTGVLASLSNEPGRAPIIDYR
jgi:hypothetical protein